MVSKGLPLLSINLNLLSAVHQPQPATSLIQAEAVFLGPKPEATMDGVSTNVEFGMCSRQGNVHLMLLQDREDASMLTPRQLTGQASDLAQLLSSPSLAGSATAESVAPLLTATLLNTSRSSEAASAGSQVHFSVAHQTWCIFCCDYDWGIEALQKRWHGRAAVRDSLTC